MDTNYQTDLAIEPDALDLEWLRHPQKYMHYAELCAISDKKVKKLKKELDVLSAQIDNDVRLHEGKTTEAMIKSKITLDPRYQAKTDELIDAQYESDIYTAAVRSFEHRRSSLENLVKLYAGQYFAGPKEPKDIRREESIRDRALIKERDKARKETSRKIG